MNEPTNDPRKRIKASFNLGESGRSEMPESRRKSAQGQTPPTQTGTGFSPSPDIPVPPVHQTSSVMRNPVDPLSQPYKLPSGGVFYGGVLKDSGGIVYISPMRGEQEEVLAGASEGANAGVALRHVVGQCVDLQGYPINQLIIEDWTAILLHVLALSAGDDRISMRPVCGGASAGVRGCGKTFDATMSLTDLPCDMLRLPLGAEKPNWPDETELDSELALMAEITGENLEQGQKDLVVDPTCREPFTSKPLPIHGSVVQFRFLRIADIIMAEQFGKQMEETQTTPGSPMHTFTLARHIMSIDGREAGSSLSATWIRKNPSRVNAALRKEIERRSFGYDVRPKFECSHCGYIFRAWLPLDGRLFRSDIS